MEGIPSAVPLGPCVPSLWPCWATEEATSLFDWGREQALHLLGSDPPRSLPRPAVLGPTGACGQRLRGLYSRSVPIHLDGVDTVLGPAPTLKEGTLALELQALASEVVALKDF